MAKPTDHTLENAAPTIGEIAVPDEASLGWSAAEHVFVRIDSQEMGGEFYARAAGPGEEASVIEFAATQELNGNQLVDIDGLDLEVIDLNELLGDAGIAPELTLAVIPDGPDSARSAMGAPLNAERPHVDLMTGDLAFASLSVVIDDESGSDTVAL